MGRALGIALLLNVPSVVLAGLGLQVFRSAVPPGLQAIIRSPLWPLLVVGTANIPLLGYELRITRQVFQGDDLPLPAWSDISGILRDGALLWVVITSWSVVSRSIEYISGSRYSGDNLSVLAVLGILAEATVYILIQPAAQGRLAATMSLRAGMEPASILSALAGHLWQYVRLALVLLVLFGISIVIGIALVLLVSSVAGQPLGQATWRSTIELSISLAWLVTGPYVRFVLAHLIGQIASKTSPR